MKGRVLLIVSFLSFIILGLPDGMLGVAWPSISRGYGIPLGQLGVLMIGFTGGYVTTTALLGTIIGRFGYAFVMIGAAGSLVVGALGMFLSPWWVGVIVAMAFLGTGSGLLDGGLNAYGAAFFRPRDLNWLHAFYGIGASLGPAIMTPLILTDIGWHGGYAILAIAATGIVLAFLATRTSWLSRIPAQTTDPGAETGADGSNRVSNPRTIAIAAASIVLFFLYTGLEVVAGQWSFSLFTIGRGVSAVRAGTWVGVYWAALTIGRVLFGWIAERVAVPTILRGALAGAAVGIALLFVASIPFAAPIGMAILGFSLAPIFPLLIGETPRRVGPVLSDHVIGLQIAAANVGAVSLVGMVGYGVERRGLEFVPLALLVSFVVFTLLHELLYLIEPHRQNERAAPSDQEL